MTCPAAARGTDGAAWWRPRRVIAPTGTVELFLGCRRWQCAAVALDDPRWPFPGRHRRPQRRYHARRRVDPAVSRREGGWWDERVVARRPSWRCSSEPRASARARREATPADGTSRGARRDAVSCRDAASLAGGLAGGIRPDDARHRCLHLSRARRDEGALRAPRMVDRGSLPDPYPHALGTRAPEVLAIVHEYHGGSRVP